MNPSPYGVPLKDAQFFPFPRVVRCCLANLISLLFQFTALLISVPFTDLQLNQKGIQNMQGFLYLIVTEVIFTFAYNVFHTFPREVPVMLREIGGGLYKPGPYYLSKMIGLVSVKP